MSDSKQIHVSSIRELKNYGITDIAVAIGVFDGVHRGHRKLLETLAGLAAELNVSPVALTFSPHPRELLHPMAPPVQLIPPEEKLRLLAECGMKAVVTIPFTREFASLSPEAFLDDCLSAEGVRIHGICVGSQWRFGALGRGDTGLLARIAHERGFRFIAVDELKCGNDTVSSTAIRHAIASGDFRKAKELLGRNYALFGKVVKGYGIAGSDLGHPTANLDIKYGIGTRYGVYAGFAHFDGVRHPAVIAIGVAPTFDGHGSDRPRIEIHLLDFHRDIYDKELKLELVAFLREERRFDSAEELKNQIVLDVINAGKLLNMESQNDG